jgi:hypothetical protein
MSGLKQECMKSATDNKVIKNKGELEKKLHHNFSDKEMLNDIRKKYAEVYSCFENVTLEKNSKKSSKKSALVYNLNFLLLSIELAIEPESVALNDSKDEIRNEAFKLSLNYSERIFDILLKGTPFNYASFEDFYSKYIKKELDSNLSEGDKRKNIDKKMKNIFKALFLYYDDLIKFSKDYSKNKEIPSFSEKLGKILEESNEKKIDIEDLINCEKKIPSLIKNGLGEADQKVLRQMLVKDKRSKVYFGLEKFIYY